MLDRTWDGQPVASEPPWGASVIVYRRRPDLEVLLLHRAHEGPSPEAACPLDANVRLSHEHDRMEWVVPAIASARSLPASVGVRFEHLERLLAR